ncbi:MnhB domain-containing protein [Pseudogemmobacter bohemicus]|uniref:MnhB domain-containing protein n=1 Tax=Pseudogemmobacter bohemicus TaxID=2250708 RepID=UPI000DD2DAC4|nr:MnhB domain-containing protein [Pseudogemmobacter bohemicus]
MRSPILGLGARFLLPLFLISSLYILLRGHNAPGGGFIGGLIAALGFAILIFAEGTAAARRALKIEPRNLGGIGLLCALLAGFGAAPSGGAPFQGLWLALPVLPLSTVLLFDIGVYFAVLGGVLTLIFALEEGGDA